MPSGPRHTPVRSEAAIKALCVSVLSRVPTLHHVTAAEIRRSGQRPADRPASDPTIGPTWELALVLPPLSPVQWRRAREAIEPWRHRFALMD